MKVGILGHFAVGKTLLNGQTVKTKIVTAELERLFTEQEVLKIDTHGGMKVLFSLPFQTLRAARTCDNIVIFPAKNGLRVITPLLTFWNLLFRRSLHYAVIGGWLPEFLESRKLLAKQLQRFDGVYVETETMKSALEKQGFENVIVMPNCKELTILDPSELNESPSEPYRLCTFSRVMKEKGIEDAVQAVKAVNESCGRTVYELVIYGQVDAMQTEWFETLQQAFPAYVTYGGCIPFDRSTEVLKDCFALLFPTYYSGEGFAGTLIDAMAAGLPTIASDWRYNADVVRNWENGVLFPVHDLDKLQEILMQLCDDPSRMLQMRQHCLEEAETYRPERVIRILTDRMR